MKSSESESFISEQHSVATAGLPLGALLPISKMSKHFKGTGLRLTQPGTRAEGLWPQALPQQMLKAAPTQTQTPTSASAPPPLLLPGSEVG